MSERIETVDEFTYRFRKMNAFDQLHVARRLAPILAGLGGLSKLSLDSAFGPIAQALAALKDDDVNYIIQKCLGAVDRKLPGGGFMVVWNKDANQSQFQDLELGALLKLTGIAMEHNLQGFLSGMSLNITSEPPPT